MSTNSSSKTKFASMVTYILALVVMIAVLFVPLFEGNTMLISMLPSALAKIGLDLAALGVKLPAFFAADFYFISAFPINLSAWAIIAYIVFVVFGIIALLPICIANRYKKTANVFAYLIQVFAMLTLGLFLFDRMYYFSVNGFAMAQLGYLIAIVFGFVWLTTLIQCFANKGATGIAKIILFILSAASVIGLCISPNFLYFVEVKNIAAVIKASDFFLGDYNGMHFILDPIALFTASPISITNILAMASVVFVLLNFVIEIIGMATTSYKGAKVFNLIRYILTLCLLGATAIMAAVDKQPIGILLYVIMIIVFLQIVVSIIRMFTGKAKIVEAVEEAEETVEETDEDETYALPLTPAEENGWYENVDSAYTPANDLATAAPMVDTNVYENDAFLKTLTPAEKREFMLTFIEKRRGNFYYLPEYNMGGDNKEFFQTLFVNYLSKLMDLISPELLNKIYKHLNML